MSEMQKPSFREKLLEILSATGYNINLTPDQLMSYENDENLQNFTEWFTLNISKDNCITPEELEEFQKLQENGQVLYGEDLENALQEYSQCPGEVLLPLSDSENKKKQEELLHLQDQLALKEKLFTVMSNSASSLEADVNELKADLKEAKMNKDKALIKLNMATNTYSHKLNDMKTILKGLQEDISSVAQDCGTSTDEGIGTLTPGDIDHLNTSFGSTISTVSSVSSFKYTSQSSSKFLCQLSFDKYYKLHKKFCKIMDGVVLDKITKLVELCDDPKINIDLELKFLMDKLLVQKKQLISNEVKINKIKAAREKINEILTNIRSKTFKPNELLSERSLSDCISSPEEDMDNLDDILNQWVLYKTRQIKQDYHEEMVAVESLVNSKLEQFMQSMKIKSAANTVLCHLLYSEGGRVEKAISLFETASNKVQQNIDNVSKRLNVMKENIEDYNEFCAQSGEEHNELLQCLANVFGSEVHQVEESLNFLQEQCNLEQDKMVRNHEYKLQHLILAGHQLKTLHDNYMEERMEPQNITSAELLDNIQRKIDEMGDAVQEAIIYCESLQNNEGDASGGENEIEAMLQKIMENGEY